MSTSHLTCSVCLDDPTRPIVTRCGHLMCWPCLQQWARRERSENGCGRSIRCPVCKGGIDPDSHVDVHPILGTGDAVNPPPANSNEQAPPRQPQPANHEAGSPGTPREPPRADRAAEPQVNPQGMRFGFGRPHARFGLGGLPFLFIWGGGLGWEMLPMVLIPVIFFAVAHLIANGNVGLRRGLQAVGFPQRWTDGLVSGFLIVVPFVLVLYALTHFDLADEAGLEPASRTHRQARGSDAYFDRGHPRFGPSVTIR
jgi:hypothetical protein